MGFECGSLLASRQFLACHHMQRLKFAICFGGLTLADAQHLYNLLLLDDVGAPASAMRDFVKIIPKGLAIPPLNQPSSIHHAFRGDV